MAIFVTKRSEIPRACFYVCATDTFMSGWGGSEGKTNRVILPCDNVGEAERVCDYANSRSDTKRVTICSRKPTLRNSYNTYSLMSKDDAPRWYE